MTGPPVGSYSAWYDASQITGVADGASLASWADESGNGYTATATGTAEPTYYSSTHTINGLPCVLFNGSSNIMIASGFPVTAQPTTIFVVASLVSLANSGRVVDSTTGSGTRQFVDLNRSSNYAYYAGTVQAAGSPTVGTHIAAALFQGASSLLRIDQSTVSSGSSPGTDSIEAIALGGNPTLAQLGNTYLCEVLFYPSALTLTQIQSVEAYLKAKWVTPPAGTAAFTATLTSSAVGAVAITGTAAQSISLTATAVGVVTIVASASFTATLSSSAVGKVGVAATAADPITLTSTAAGAIGIPATAAESMSLTATAVGTLAATAPNTSTLTGNAVGVVTVPASSSALNTLSATAVGVVAIAGSASFTAVLTGHGVATIPTATTVGSLVALDSRLTTVMVRDQLMTSAAVVDSPLSTI